MAFDADGEVFVLIENLRQFLENSLGGGVGLIAVKGEGDRSGLNQTLFLIDLDGTGLTGL